MWKDDEWDLNVKSSSNLSQNENPSNYEILKQEYDRLIETNHCLAEQYGKCQREKEKLMKDNIELKQSLKECEIIIQNKMRSDNETWNEMETVHYELKQRFKTAQIEIQRFKSLVDQQNEQIKELEKLLKVQNHKKTTSKQTEHRLRDEIKMYKTEINSIKSAFKKSQQIIHQKQSQIDSLSKQNKSNIPRPTTSPIHGIDGNLNGALGTTLKILHEELYQSLRPKIFILWKKWIYALMQHFENKLKKTVEFQQNEQLTFQNFKNDLDFDGNPATNKVPLRLYNEPRIIVKYKKKRKKTRNANNSVVKTEKNTTTIPRKKTNRVRPRSQTLRKSASNYNASTAQNMKKKSGSSHDRHIKSCKRLPRFRF